MQTVEQQANRQQADIIHTTSTPGWKLILSLMDQIQHEQLRLAAESCDVPTMMAYKAVVAAFDRLKQETNRARSAQAKMENFLSPYPETCSEEDPNRSL